MKPPIQVTNSPELHSPLLGYSNAGVSRQRGMYLVLAALLAAGLLFGLLQIVQVAQQSQQQAEREQIAQYAAEAVAVVIARDLNFKAITNRAMLANEVAIGQILGLHSWYEMSRETAVNLATVTVWIPYLNSVTGQIANLMNQLRQPMQVGATAAITLQQGVLQALSYSQSVSHNASTLGAYSSAKAVVAANNSNYELAVLNHASIADSYSIWLTAQSNQPSRAAQGDYIRMAAMSRDPFTARRSYRWATVLNVAAYRAGGSEISRHSSGQVNWQAFDTSQLHISFPLFNEYVPAGGGASYLTTPVPRQRYLPGFGDSFSQNWTTSNQTARKQQRLASGHTIPRYYQLVDQRIIGEQQPLRIRIAIVQRPETLAEGVAQPYAVGEAEIFYRRPQGLWPRQDGLRERPNLHNALWQIRASTVAELTRLLIGEQL